MHNSLKIIEISAIWLVLISGFSLPISAQPTGYRDLNSHERRRLTENVQEKLNNLSEQIKIRGSDLLLYKERLQLYRNLLELNFDNSEWERYADNFEADLSRIIKLEQTSENYIERGGFLQERFHRSPRSAKFTELYPRNRYFELSVLDYYEALKRTNSPQLLQSVYSSLSGLYSSRPQKLESNRSLVKLHSSRLELLLGDLNAAIKFGHKALEVGAGLPFADELKRNLVSIYMASAETATKLGIHQGALKFYDEGEAILKQISPARDEWLCSYYVGWGKTYIKVGNPGNAVEKFNLVSTGSKNFCPQLLWNKADAYVAMGKFEQALAHYNIALTFDPTDSQKGVGWLYLKRAKLFLRTGRLEEALSDLQSASEKKYAANCPQLYEIRAEVHNRLDKPELAINDKQTAKELINQTNCRFE